MRPAQAGSGAWAARCAAVALEMIWATSAWPAALTVAAGGQNLAAAIDAAAPGNVLTLAAGVLRGPVRIEKPLTLAGRPGAGRGGGGGGRAGGGAARGGALRN